MSVERKIKTRKVGANIPDVDDLHFSIDGEKVEVVFTNHDDEDGELNIHVERSNFGGFDIVEITDDATRAEALKSLGNLIAILQDAETYLLGKDN